eukprot:gene26234-biopygen2817
MAIRDNKAATAAFCPLLAHQGCHPKWPSKGDHFGGLPESTKYQNQSVAPGQCSTTYNILFLFHFARSWVKAVASTEYMILVVVPYLPNTARRDNKAAVAALSFLAVFGSSIPVANTEVQTNRMKGDGSSMSSNNTTRAQYFWGLLSLLFLPNMAAVAEEGTSVADLMSHDATLTVKHVQLGSYVAARGGVEFPENFCYFSLDNSVSLDSAVNVQKLNVFLSTLIVL